MGGDTVLHAIVYRDGNWNEDILILLLTGISGVIVYIYLFGKGMLYASTLPYRSFTALSTVNVIVSISLPVRRFTSISTITTNPLQHIYLDILWSYVSPFGCFEKYTYRFSKAWNDASTPC